MSPDFSWIDLAWVSTIHYRPEENYFTILKECNQNMEERYLRWLNINTVYIFIYLNKIILLVNDNDVLFENGYPVYVKTKYCMLFPDFFFFCLKFVCLFYFGGVWVATKIV